MQVTNSITLGRRSWTKPTPAAVMFWTDVYSAMAGQFIGWIKTTNLIGHNAGDIASEILGQSLMYVIILRRFFGVTTSQKVVSIDKVNVLESDPVKMLYLVLCYDVIRYIIY